MAKATIDWQHHIDAYLAQYGDVKHIPDYARANGLAEPSARRAMRPAVVAALEAKSAPTENNAAIKLSKTVRNKVKEATAERQKGKRQAATPAPESDRKPPKGSDRNRIESSDRSDKKRSNEKRSDGASPVVARAEVRGADTRPAAGAKKNKIRELAAVRPTHAYSLDFGGYASFFEFDEDIQGALEGLISGSSELAISTGRLAMMIRAQNQALRQIDEDYANGEAWLSDEGLRMPRAQAKMQTMFGPSQRMSELENNIGKAKLGLRKQNLAELQDARTAHPLTKAEQIARTAELMRQRKADDLTALECARLFDEEGLPLPPTLQAEMLKEVTLLELSTDSEGGVTPEELAAATAAWLADRKYKREVWLPERDAKIAAIVAENAAYQAGELLGEGDFKEGGVLLDEDGAVLVDENGRYHPDHSLPDDEDDDDNLDADGNTRETW